MKRKASDSKIDRGKLAAKETGVPEPRISSGKGVPGTGGNRGVDMARDIFDSPYEPDSLFKHRQASEYKKEADEWWRDYEVTSEFRSQVEQLFPALKAEPRLWGVFALAVFSTMRRYDLFEVDADHDSLDDVGKDDIDDSPDDDLSEQARFPVVFARRERVAFALRLHANFKKGSPFDWLRQFSREVFPLDITEGDVYQGLQTTFIPQIPKPLKQLIDAEKFRMAQILTGGHDAATPTVTLTDGKVIKNSKKHTEKLYPREPFEAEQNNIAATHPAYPFVELNCKRKTKRVEDEIIKGNKLLFGSKLAEIPKSAYEARRRDRAQQIWNAIKSDSRTFYKATEASPRLYVTGPSILRLPREYRSIVLRGCYEFDLKACQLAIVSRIWDVPQLRKEMNQCLAENIDVWWLLCDQSKVNSKDWKPIFKTALYSTIFGGSEDNIRDALIHEAVERLEVNLETATSVAERFGDLPMIRELLEARERINNQIKGQGYVEDAFGKTRTLEEAFELKRRKWSEQTAKKKARNQWIADAPTSQSRRFRASMTLTEQAIRSLMAYVVQSYELKLMLSMKDILNWDDQQIYFLGYLFDSIFLYLPNERKVDRQIRHLKEAVEKEARRLKIPTQLSEKKLTNEGSTLREKV